MKPLDDVIGGWHAQQLAHAQSHKRMSEIIEVYEGRREVPLPQLRENEKPAVPNLFRMSIDQQAMRVASTLPMPIFTPARPHIKAEREDARTRREVVQDWWSPRGNRMQRKLRFRARHLIGQAVTFARLKPDFEKRIPGWEIRKPVGALPVAVDQIDDLVPSACWFNYRMTMRDVRDKWPEKVDIFPKAYRRGGQMVATDNEEVLVVEYVDDDEIVMVASGHSQAPLARQSADYGRSEIIIEADPGGRGYTWFIELERLPNRARRPLVVMGGAITLDAVNSAYEASIGMYEAMAEAMAMQSIAMKRAIIREVYLEGDGPNAPEIVQEADARDGTVGIVKGGRLRDFAPDSSLVGLPLTDRYERAMRHDTGTPPELGGESQTGVRTGRRGELILGATIDFPIQEYQETLALCLEEEHQIAFAIDRGWWRRSKPVNIGFDNVRGAKTYEPGKLWDGVIHEVLYPMAGSDLNSLEVRVDQKLGTEKISMQTARELDPEIRDPEFERDQRTFESIESAILAEIQEPGSMPLKAKLKIMKLVQSNQLELGEAIEKVQEEMQEEQAEQAGGDPAGQVGLERPEFAPPQQPQAPPDLASLAQGLARPGVG